MRSRMRTSIAALRLLFVWLLLVAGCGEGEEGEAPPETSSESAEETAPTTAPATVSESEASRTPTVIITNSEGERVEVEVEIADTRTEQARGLMERIELAENAGMLFILKSEPSPG